MKEKAILSWSGGKDSALALHELQMSGRYEVVSLITTITRDYDRVSIHGIPQNIIETQAKSIGVPVSFVYIAANATNEEYEKQFCSVLLHYKAQGVDSVVYGDIFLEALRDHREAMLNRIGIRGIFPLWKQDTNFLAWKFIDQGFRGLLSCVDTEAMSASFAAREFDQNLLQDLPSSIDPCGERGEFHSCVYAGPIFESELSIKRLGRVHRNQFCFANVTL